MLFSGVSVAVGLLIVAAGFLLVFDGMRSLEALPELFYGELNSFALLSIPMFIIMGAAIASTRAGPDLYEALERWLTRVPGGLVVSNLGACALFAAMSGSSPATCAAIGKMGIPEMRKRGYPDGVAAGSIAAGGTLGILIPPSVTMIVYGIATETSIGRLFLAGRPSRPAAGGAVHGLGDLSTLAARGGGRGAVRRSPTAGGRSSRSCPASCRSSRSSSACSTRCTAASRRRPRPPRSARCCASSSRCVIYRLYQPARALGGAARLHPGIGDDPVHHRRGGGVLATCCRRCSSPSRIAEWIADAGRQPLGADGVINLFLLVAGFFLPPVAVILMAAPILLPIITTAGFDPIWFAVILTINMEIGLITPPVGLNLYVINGIAPDISLKTILVGLAALRRLHGAGDRDPVRLSRASRHGCPTT